MDSGGLLGFVGWMGCECWNCGKESMQVENRMEMTEEFNAGEFCCQCEAQGHQMRVEVKKWVPSGNSAVAWMIGGCGHKADCAVKVHKWVSRSGRVNGGLGFKWRSCWCFLGKGVFWRCAVGLQLVCGCNAATGEVAFSQICECNLSNGEMASQV